MMMGNYRGRPGEVKMGLLDTRRVARSVASSRRRNCPESSRFSMRAPWSALVMAGAFCIVPLSLTAQIDARLLRQPDVSATQIAFVYAGDIWVAPKAGGVAVRLSSPRGEESFPRFSPDGKEIAFTGDYD